MLKACVGCVLKERKFQNCIDSSEALCRACGSSMCLWERQIEVEVNRRKSDPERIMLKIFFRSNVTGTIYKKLQFY